MHSPSKRLLALGLAILLGAFTLAQDIAAQGPPLRLGPDASYVSNGALPAQASAADKDEGTATILSIVIIGAGQIYAGDTSRGLMMLGGAYGAIIVGAVLSTSAGCDYNFAFDDLSCHDANLAPLYLGALAAAGIWVWSIVDAAPTTRRMNEMRRLALLETGKVLVSHENGRTRVGLRQSF
jgi:hypothetical protein